MGFKIITPPAAEQISLVQARLHLRLDDDGDSPAANPDDPLLAIQIPAAREWCERWMARALATQTVELALDKFPAAEIELPFSPVQSITSVTYLDANSASQTLSPSNYTLDNYQEPGWILPAVGTVWPTTATVVNAVKVRYVVGYSLPTETQTYPLPFSLKAAMLLALGALYENREEQSETKLELLPLGAQALMMPYRLRLALA